MRGANVKIQFNLNNKVVSVTTYPMKRLIDVLREDLHLTGTKEGCGEGECGACSVFINGELINACLVPIIQVKDCEVTTIEGIATQNELDIVQESFINNNGAQCGICTPGMILSANNLLMNKSNPSEEDTRTYLAGNLCRCTGYNKIVNSVKEASKLMRRS